MRSGVRGTIPIAYQSLLQTKQGKGSFHHLRIHLFTVLLYSIIIKKNKKEIGFCAPLAHRKAEGTEKWEPVFLCKEGFW